MPSSGDGPDHLSRNELGEPDVQYEWVPCSGFSSKAGSDPLATLAAPTHLRAGGRIDGVTSLVATYPAGALGLNDADDRSVAIAIHPDGSVVFTYELEIEGGSPVSRTTLTKATDTTPITPPA